MELNLLSLLFVLLRSSSSLASSCEDISGSWVNNLGSEVVMDHKPTGVLAGKYYSAVSGSGGRPFGHDIVGTLPFNKPGSSFAFSVTWHNGSSTTVWTGQCQVCGGKEILETSWLERPQVDSCVDLWKSTLIGKYIFERKQTKGNYMSTSETTRRVSFKHKCDLRGIWYNDLGSEMILNQTESGAITGEYRTAVERERGSAGSTHSLIYGSAAFGNPNTTFSLIIVWRGGASVTGFVGQCHICENNTAVLETSWLLRSKVDSCDDVWKSTMYGVNSFTRHEKKPGPRKSLGTHTPDREGEDVDRSTNLMVSNILLTTALVCVWLFHH